MLQQTPKRLVFDMTENEKYSDYLKTIRGPFQKLCRLRFLQPDGSTAFMLDNDPYNRRSTAFIADGSTISHNWQNGRRTNATVVISNIDGEYEYNYNHVWFGQEIAIDEGVILSDGMTEFYIQQGVFLIEEPDESVQPNQKTVTYNLVDKVAALDGSLGGNLEDTYQVLAGTNIFQPIAQLLSEDKGNGYPIDRVNPVFTEYYNNKTQELPDGTTASMVLAPYTLTVEGGQTKWNVIEGLVAMVNGWVGYDETGALRIDPSQDDILDSEKPVEWQFTMEQSELLGLSYKVKNPEVYNDYIVVGEMLSNYAQPNGRAQIFDSRSPVSIDVIGRKTFRESKAGFGTDKQCRDYAEWMLKRASVLRMAVTVSCSQIFHIRGNQLITVTRTDKPGNPVERHLVQGFSRPLASNGPMTITATSTQDFSTVTLSSKTTFQLYSDDTFSLQTRNGAKNWDGILEYSHDQLTWTEWNGTVAIQSAAYINTHSIFLRGNGNTRLTNNTPTGGFLLTGANINCYGSIEFLLDYQKTDNGIHPKMADNAFAYLFKGNNNLITPPSLPAVALTEFCYFAMFYQCAGLTSAPELPAIKLTEGCYEAMFRECTGLRTTPALPSVDIAPSCYESMFLGCTALNTLPKLPSKNLSDSCYSFMFNECTNIKLSTTSGGEYTNQYRIPLTGNATEGNLWNTQMFGDTGGTFTGNPSANTTYYTPNEII